MEYDDIPELIIKYFEESERPRTPYTADLHYIFKSLIKEYFILKDVTNSQKGPDYMPKRFNKTRSNYSKLAIKISYDLGKGEKYVEDSFLKNLCFPEREQERNREKLVDIFKYLNDFLQDSHAERDGRYWVDRWEDLKRKREKQLKNESSPKAEPRIKGGNYINSSYIDLIGKNNHVSKIEFYVGKQNNECQWYGVLRKWDYERQLHKTVKSEIRRSYQTDRTIAAVIAGTGGVGKSTFLRHMAISCIDEDFSVIWLYDVDLFYDHDIERLSAEKSRYLLIIDSWKPLGKNKTDAFKFLKRIENARNIKVLIGDRDNSGKNYREYILSENIFELLPDENERIIQKIARLNVGWELIINEFVKESDFLHSPIYIILFVVARYSELKRPLTTQPIMHVFWEIIEDDVKTLFKEYKGLAQALYYWSCIYREYHIFITWSAFLALADYYNGDNEVSSNLLRFESDTAIHKILFHYVSLQHFLNPDLVDVNIITFHHDMLIDEGLAKVLIPDMKKFDDPKKEQIARILVQSGKYNSAVDLVRVILRTNKVRTNPITFDKDFVDRLIPKRKRYLSISRAREHETFLRNAIFITSKAFSDKPWEWVLFNLIFVIGFSPETLIIIFDMMINVGASKRRVKAIQHYFYDDNYLNLNEYFDYCDPLNDLYYDLLLRYAGNEGPRIFVEVDNGQEVVYDIDKYLLTVL